MSISNRKPGTPKEAPAEPLKRAISGAMKAIARKPEMEIVFAADKPSLVGERARLPEPPRKLTAGDVAILRGHADSMALRLACHDAAIHRRAAPEGDAARAVFDAIEQARVESIGARRMSGTASNITAMLEDRYHRGGRYEEITDRADAPLEDALALMVRERLTGLKPPKAAEKIVRDELDKLPQLAAMKGRDFYAVGGTWRALATLHQRRANYPLNVMHGYTIPPKDAADFVKLVERADASVLDAIDAVSSARRPLLAYGALVLDELIKRGKPGNIVISAQGVREGLLHEQLPAEERAADPLLQSARDYNLLRARDPRHAAELVAWTRSILETAGLAGEQPSNRLIEAVCLLSDIGWRAHPDYRGEQSMNVIAHAYFTGIDQVSRAFLAIAIFHRYAGLKASSPAAGALRTLLQPSLFESAVLIAAIFRVAYLLSAGMAGILPRIPAQCVDRRLVLRLPEDLAALASERVEGRLKQLAKLLGRDYELARA